MLPASISEVKFADGQEYLAAASTSGKVNIWEPKRWTVVSRKDAGGPVEAIAISFIGDMVAVGTKERLIVWKGRKANYEDSIEKQFNAPVTALAFSNDSKYLACGTLNGDIFILNAKDLTLVNRLYELGNGIGSLEYSLDNKVLGCAGQGWMVWDPAKKTRLTTLPTGVIVQKDSYQNALTWHNGNYTKEIALSPHGDYIGGIGHISQEDGGVPRSMTVRKVSDGTVVRTIRPAQEPFTSVQWSHDDSRMVAGCEDGAVWVWKWKSGDVSKIPCQVGSIASIALSRASNVLAVAGGDKIEIRNLYTGTLDKTLAMP